jgi:hypothetical protein
MTQFGWIPPTDEKLEQNERYLVRSILRAPLTVEKELPYPKEFNYDQISGSCTGYSASWAQSIYNNKKYNGMWIYRRGQDTDNDPNTKDDNDGGYIWAVFDRLRLEGHALWNTETPIKDEGILSYYWCKTIDDVRAAIDANRVPVFGVYWFSEFQTPRTVNGESWIGTRANWGGVLGGHAIACIAASDKRQAFKLLNTWGSDYPPVWISYKSITRLMGLQGECAVGMDIPAEPDPEPGDDMMAVNAIVDGREYGGTLERVK